MVLIIKNKMGKIQTHTYILYIKKVIFLKKLKMKKKFNSFKINVIFKEINIHVFF